MASTYEAVSSIAGPSFTDEQKGYLQGFFAAAIQQIPSITNRSSGLHTNLPDSRITGVSMSVAEEPTFWGTPVSDLCAEEVWKYERNPLDVWDDLLAHAAENRFPDAEFRFRFKYYGLFHVAPAQDSFMLRLRIPGGCMTSAQMKGLADLAKNHGSGRLDLTTRANVQIREFAPKSIIEVLKAIQRLGMSARGSGADNIRNITASPTSGFDKQELIDVQPYAEALQNYISNSRDMHDLPRKFNISFDNGGSLSALASTNDIGFVAIRVAQGRSIPPGIYFRVLLGGISGHKQLASDSGLLLRPDQLVSVAAAMVRVFIENGDRTDRKKARLKYLLDLWGIEKFLEETEKKLTFPILRIEATECEPRAKIDRTGHLGVHAQAQGGLHYVGVVVPVGQLAADQAHSLASIAERFGNGELRLTVWQNILIPNIRSQELDATCLALRDAGLDYEAGRVISGTVACTGSRGCRFAATDTKAHAVELARTLDSKFNILKPVNLHVTGCPNHCAQPYVGDIGLMAVKVGGADGYQLSLGGGADNDEGLGRRIFAALPYDGIKLALDRLFISYEQERYPNEDLLGFTRRHSVEELRAICTTGAASQGGCA